MLMLIFIVLILPLTILSQDDPCKNYKMLYDDGGRSVNCDRYYSESHDRFIDEGWRRVQLEPTGEDLTMPTQCVQDGYCGSHSNVWLNGAHPTVEDGIVNRTGCLSMFSSCCKEQYPIRIKNCTDYMVYNLMRLRPTDTRYCFGDSAHCSPSTVSSTTKTPRQTTVSSTTKTPRQTTVSSTTKTPRQTTVSSTTKTTRPTTVSSTTKTPRQTTVSSTTKTPRPTTVPSTTEMIRSNTVGDEMKPSSVNDNQRDSQKTDNVPDELDVVSNIQYFQSDKLVLILGVCLSMTMALLITLVVGIFFILKQSIVRPKPTNV